MKIPTAENYNKREFKVGVLGFAFANPPRYFIASLIEPFFFLFSFPCIQQLFPLRNHTNIRRTSRRVENVQGDRFRRIFNSRLPSTNSSSFYFIYTG